MKTILTSLLLLCFLHGQSQIDHKPTYWYKQFEDTSGKYVIKYKFNLFGGSYTPLTMNGKPHYNAVIEVLQIIGKDSVVIGDAIQGIYVEGGCSEDQPSDYVRKAKENSHLPKVVTPVPITLEYRPVQMIWVDSIPAFVVKNEDNYYIRNKDGRVEVIGDTLGLIRGLIEALDEKDKRAIFENVRYHELLDNYNEFERSAVLFLNTIPDYWYKGPAWIKFKKVLAKNGYKRVTKK